MSFKIADNASAPARGDVFKVSTVKGAASYIAMDEVTVSDTDKIAAALSAIDIDGSNNTIIYDDDGVLSNNRDTDGKLVEGNYKKIVVPSGRYTPEELAAEIEKLLEENNVGDSYAVEFDRETHKFSITSNDSNPNPVTFLWEAEETTAEFDLGFSTAIFSITKNYNDQMAFTEDGLSVALITLDPRSYTGDQMATEIQYQMNRTLTQDFYKVSYDSDTREFTISNPAVNENDNTLNTLNVQLNWTASTVTENTAVTFGFNLGDTDIDLGQKTESNYIPGSLDSSRTLVETANFSVAEAQVGDNRNVLNITDIEDQKLLDEGSLTFDAYYNKLNGDVGSKTAETSRGAEHQTYMVTQYEERRSSISGVSIDEEMINLIKYQQAYAVSAKLISTLDQMLDVLVNI
jgi:flagellar hook-associated protein FlgK